MSVADGRCAACGAATLVPHLTVGTAAGPENLIPTTDRYGSALADIVRCTTCGHMQLERFPDEAELTEAYGDAASSDYIDEEVGQRATARAVLDLIERYVQRGALADLGCWVGFLLAEARERGWRVQGVEPSEFASAYARDRLGLPVETAGLFEAELAAGGFEAVMLGDVIEHLPDPAEALGRVRELLAEGGVIALALPDAGSRVARLMGPRWWSVIPTHVQYFTRHSMAELLRRAGYQPLAIRTNPKAFTVDYYLGRIGGYQPQLSSLLRDVADRSGVGQRLWAPDFRDRMLVIARAKGARTLRRL